MNTFFVSWNPDESDGNPDLWEHYFLRDGYLEMCWSFQAFRLMRPGDRVIFIMQGDRGGGAFAHGHTRTSAYAGEDWRGTGKPKYYLWMRFDVFIHPEIGFLATNDELRKQPGRKHLYVFASGARIAEPEQVVENLWTFLEARAAEKNAIATPALTADDWYNPLRDHPDFTAEAYISALKLIFYS